MIHVIVFSLSEVSTHILVTINEAENQLIFFLSK